MTVVQAPELRVLDRMPTIGLAELVERAALLRRTDRKYVLTAAELPRLLAALRANDARVLCIDGRVEQDYRTVYFDTPTMDFYRATALRRRRRAKVRVRTYLPDGPNFLEVKTRTSRGSTVKYRFAHADGGWPRIDDYSQTDDCLADAGMPGREGRPLTWTVATSYRRSTLFVPGTGARVTIDSGLSWALPDGRCAEAPQTVIVETKSPTVAATALDRVLWAGHHRPYGLSKFGLGLAMLRPELPANRWAVVLRRHFPAIGRATIENRRHWHEGS